AEVLRASERRSDANIRLIARDQTTKTIGKLNEVRQTGVGITHYRWSTSQDQRVRPSHAFNAGQMFSWDRPPDSTGHPGSDIQCRCVAVPVIEVGGEILGPTPRPSEIAGPRQVQPAGSPGFSAATNRRR
ncbi:MAG: minor capsid protein, partial [Rhodococcus sp.]|nr:minor capsid protein [Rhodococcus sp. (in: high G+C Gram-positive bacteria)]